MSTARPVLAVSDLPVQRHGSRLVTRDASLSALGPDLDPFIAVSLYDMRGPTFPPHPHAGFMVATYILPESEVGFVNQDSLGNHNAIPPGALHVTVAGRGVLHEEQPQADGTMARGFQIWIDLPNAQREIEPHALHLAAPDVLRVTTPDADVRVALGLHEGRRSPLALPTPVTLLDVTLAPSARWEHALPRQDNAFVFVIAGGVDVARHRASAGQLLRTRPDGDALALRAGADGARLAVFAGAPLSQPRVMHGPFVAADPPQLERFVRAYDAGAFGRLEPMGRAGAAPPR